MESNTLPKPVKVSGFIKAVRWSLLIYGIVYGNIQWHVYRRRQVLIREAREKIRPEIEARQRLQQLQKLTDDFKGLAADFDVELPPDWTAKDL